MATNHCHLQKNSSVWAICCKWNKICKIIVKILQLSSPKRIPAGGSNKTELPHLTHTHAATHPGTIKTNCCDPAAVWTIPEKDISELPSACNRQLWEQKAVIKMTSAPWKQYIVPFPKVKSQAYFQLYFTPDNSVRILLPQLRPEMCSSEEQRRAEWPSIYRKSFTK